jgi:hypothetical protein
VGFNVAVLVGAGEGVGVGVCGPSGANKVWRRIGAMVASMVGLEVGGASVGLISGKFPSE